MCHDTWRDFARLVLLGDNDSCSFRLMKINGCKLGRFVIFYGSHFIGIMLLETSNTARIADSRKGKAAKMWIINYYHQLGFCYVILGK